MKKLGIVALIFVTSMMSCNSNKSNTRAENQDGNNTELKTDTLTKHLKPFKAELPTIGLLMYNGVLQSEVIATSDVFSKPDGPEGKQLFNVITIAETENTIERQQDGWQSILDNFKKYSESVKDKR